MPAEGWGECVWGAMRHSGQRQKHVHTPRAGEPQEDLVSSAVWLDFTGECGVTRHCRGTQSLAGLDQVRA